MSRGIKLTGIPRPVCCGKDTRVRAVWKNKHGEKTYWFHCKTCSKSFKNLEVIKPPTFSRPTCCGKELKVGGKDHIRGDGSFKRYFVCGTCYERQTVYFKQNGELHENQEPRTRFGKGIVVAVTERKKKEKKLSALEKYMQPDPIPTPQLDPMMLWGLSMETRRSLSTNQGGLRA